MINIPGLIMLTKLEELIEEVYGLPFKEFPSQDFHDMGVYTEALSNGYHKRNWIKYKPKRDRKGFSLGDDLHLKLLLMCEKVFNITIMDEEAEMMNTIYDLEKYVKQRG
jgi:hypothetical protein